MVLASSRLFQPLKIGNITTSQRIVMAPLTRFRADDDYVPMPFVKDYYAERAVEPGSLIISEAVHVSLRAGGLPNVPGIWTDAQIAAWREITDLVHEKGSYIFCQLVGVGRHASPEHLAKDGLELIGPSAIPIDEQHSTPRPVKEDEIWGLIGDFVQAAKNAIERAGFDGVEIHGAHGRMIDQFTQDMSNQRTDGWGGSIEKRARFATEITKAVAAAVGKERTGIRLSPFSRYGGMRMRDPVPQFSHLIKELGYLEIGYLHLVEPRMDGDVDSKAVAGSIRPLVDAWGEQGAIILAGGYTVESARKAVEEEYKNKNVAIAFGRHFISNPDLIYRVKKGIPFTPYDRATFYSPKAIEGYLGYPSSQEVFQK